MWRRTLYSNKVKKQLWFDYNWEDNLIVSKQDETSRHFACFRSHTDFHHHIKDIPTPEQCFYEVLMGQKSRKPYFDIDVDLKKQPHITKEMSDKWIDKLIENICELVGDYFVPIIVMTSHRPDKLSYHLVVSRICLKSQVESKVFALKAMTTDLKPFVDCAVCSSVQQFRVLGNTKHGKQNPKVIDWNLTWIFHLSIG